MARPKKTIPGKATVAGAQAATQKIVPVSTAEVKTVKASVPVLSAPVKPVAPIAPPPAPAARSAAVPSTRTVAKTISQSDWRSMVEQAAYYVAEKNGFTGNPEDHWAAAEAKVRADLDAKGIKIV
jgi:hypothetical protein